MRSLSERMRAFEQQKARLANTEARLRLAEKKAHTKRLIEIGTLVEKTGFEGASLETVYGALLSLGDDLKNKKILDQWATLGSSAIAQEGDRKTGASEAVILVFPDSLSREANAVLRSEGFRYNKFLRHWEGFALFEEADELAANYGGSAKTLAGTTSAAA